MGLYFESRTLLGTALHIVGRASSPVVSPLQAVKFWRCVTGSVKSNGRGRPFYLRSPRRTANGERGRPFPNPKPRTPNSKLPTPNPLASQGFIWRDSRSSSSATRCSYFAASLGSRLEMRSSSTASSSSSSPPAIICSKRSLVISAFLKVP